jgi:U3 small nucleolar RNA-associated protein 10
VSSNNYALYLDLLLRKLQDQNGFSRSLGYLVIRALLSRLSGEHRVGAALLVLEAMCIDTLEGMDDFMRNSSDLQLVSVKFSSSQCIFSILIRS